MLAMCVVKVANALDTSFSALVSAENDWAKTAGRRRSSSIGNKEGASAAAAAVAAANAGKTSDGVEEAGSSGRRDSWRSQRRGSGDGSSGPVRRMLGIWVDRSCRRHSGGSSTGDRWYMPSIFHNVHRS